MPTRPPGSEAPSTEAVLGLWDGHGASVAVVAGGRLAFALAEERPSRRKRHSGFPSGALAAALSWISSEGLELVAVALAGRRGRLPLRLGSARYAGSDPHRDPLSWTSRVAMAWENRVGRSRLGELEGRLGAALVGRRLGLDGPLVAVEHHEAHAWAARFGRPDEALVVTADAYGEGRAATARRASSMEVLAESDPRFGLALLYGAVTVALGYQEGDEGKVMGLAARGDAGAAERFGALFSDGVEPRLRRPLGRRRVEELLAGLSREDAAAGLQACVEERAAAWIGGLVAETGCSRLLLAGGLFANVRLNQRLAELPGVEGLEVFPAMGDEGLSAGAAHRVWAERHGPARCDDVRLGAAFGEERYRAACDLGPVSVEELAGELAAGRVLCRHAGREAFGPRALGGRSILFAARPELAERVNRALGRDPIMAFGPAMTEELAPRLIESPLSTGELAGMTVTARATEELRERCPAAVHVDGTARPQVVSRSADPSFHALLSAAAERGLPALINTSFNLHGEPIVHTPEDALATWRASGLDLLVLGGSQLRR